MTANVWTNFLSLAQVLDFSDLYETRIINDADGNILYVGYSSTAGASTSEPIWYIFKLSYDINGYLNYKQLPTLGAGFKYIWDDVTTYF